MLVKDMFEKNGHNPSCGFAGDIVSYLYDEIDSAEKAKFETHLAGCTTCGTELAAFSGVRTSVANWREADFGWLPTPDIVIPYEALPEQPAVVETRGTILTDLRRLFSFSPWPPAVAAFGALAFLAGLNFFAVIYFNTKQETTLASNTNTHNPVALPTVEAAPVPSNEVTGVNKEEKSKVPDKVVNSTKTIQQEVIPVSATVPSVPKSKNTQTGNESQNSNKPAEKSTTTNKQKAPSLNNYTEEEDTTLRLADLFEEIDTRE
jgi:hypothetical protein